MLPQAHRVIASLLLLFLLVSCSKESREYTSNVGATARSVLDTPFHFLLEFPDYEPSGLTHNGDLFSAWGRLALQRKVENRIAHDAVRERLVLAAKKAGWRPVTELSDMEQPDLDHYGFASRKEDLAIIRNDSSRDQNPPTRYSCRIWISDDVRQIVAGYRVDTE
jgi:hypothetical protein